MAFRATRHGLPHQLPLSARLRGMPILNHLSRGQRGAAPFSIGGHRRSSHTAAKYISSKTLI
jgi:hypothetical protein